jgi:hypothetical protein
VKAAFGASPVNRLSKGEREHKTRYVGDEQEAANEPSASLHDGRSAPLLDDLECPTADGRGGLVVQSGLCPRGVLAGTHATPTLVLKPAGVGRDALFQSSRTISLRPGRRIRRGVVTRTAIAAALALSLPVLPTPL